MDTIFAPPTYANLTIEYHEIKLKFTLLSARVMLQPVNILKIPGSDFQVTVKYY